MEKLKLAKMLAFKAGKYIKSQYNKKKEISFKKKREMVTQVDIGAEKMIIKGIKRYFPNHSIWSEEAGWSDQKSDYIWVIDPLDGTHNYVFKIPIFSASVGLWYRGKPYIGAVYFPVTDELVWAQKGKGTFINGKKIKARKEDLSETLLMFDSNILKKKKWHDRYQNLINASFKIKIPGAATFDFVQIARGCACAYLGVDQKPGDFGAVTIILQEAGGKVTNFEGKEIKLQSENIAATNGKVHKEILRLIKR